MPAPKIERFECPLTAADWEYMRECDARCDQRRPFIDALDQLGIETGQLRQQNEAQQQFCRMCAQLRSEGRL